MVLADGAARSFLLEVYCLDYAKKAPHKGGKLALAIHRSLCGQIRMTANRVFPSAWIYQLSCWLLNVVLVAARANELATSAAGLSYQGNVFVPVTRARWPLAVSFHRRSVIQILPW